MEILVSLASKIENLMVIATLVSCVVIYMCSSYRYDLKQRNSSLAKLPKVFTIESKEQLCQSLEYFRKDCGMLLNEFECRWKKNIDSQYLSIKSFTKTEMLVVSLRTINIYKDKKNTLKDLLEKAQDSKWLVSYIKHIELPSDFFDKFVFGSLSRLAIEICDIKVENAKGELVNVNIRCVVYEEINGRLVALDSINSSEKEVISLSGLLATTKERLFSVDFGWLKENAGDVYEQWHYFKDVSLFKMFNCRKYSEMLGDIYTRKFSIMGYSIDVKRIGAIGPQVLILILAYLFVAVCNLRSFAIMYPLELVSSANNYYSVVSAGSSSLLLFCSQSISFYVFLTAFFLIVLVSIVYSTIIISYMRCLEIVFCMLAIFLLVAVVVCLVDVNFIMMSRYL